MTLPPQRPGEGRTGASANCAAEAIVPPRVESKGVGVVNKIRQSFAFGNFLRGGIPPERLFREAAQIGYAAVEMLGQEHWDAAREAGLRIAIIGGHGSLTDGLNKRENHARIEDELRAKID